MLQRTRWVVAAGLMLALALVLIPGTALAQTTSATVSGTVKDSLGGGRPGRDGGAHQREPCPAGGGGGDQCDG